MQMDTLAKLSYGSGWSNLKKDGNYDYRWAHAIAYFSFSETPQNYRLQLTVGTPTSCTLQLFQDDKKIRSFYLEEGWKSLFIDINAACGKQFTLKTERENELPDEHLGVMVAQIICQPYVNNSFYTTDLAQVANMEEAPASVCKPFISAFYYLWYFTEKSMRCKCPLEGTKWSEGYLRAILQPPQYPMLGEYLMNDPNVIEAHIDWAADHGIDCFICNWEGMVGHRKFLSENLVHILQGSEEEATLSPGKIPYSSKDSTGNGWDAESMGWSTTGYNIRNLQRMKFSILFESRLLVGQWPPNLKEKEAYTVFGDAVTYCAENFFGSPQWQRIDGKPVVYLYEVYSWLGDAEDFQKFRKRLDAAVQGIDDPLTGEKFRGVYIIADLMYPYVEPQGRFACFDAITGYQPYPPKTTGELSGYASEWKFYGAALFTCTAFQDYHKKYERWCEEHGLALIPCVIPRYNDRGVRGACDHFAFPPASQAPYTDAADVMEGKLFVSNIKAMLPYVDRRINMLNINSWNEWFEDTAIEPCGFDPSAPWPDWFGQGANIGTSTVRGRDRRIPDKVVIYAADGHKWVDTPEELKKNGIDLTQDFAWPCYGFAYLQALKRFFGL